MNEVKQVLSSLRSTSRSSTLLVNGSSSNNKQHRSNSGTTWYDLPTPVIIHCREFEDSKDKMEDLYGNNAEARKSLDTALSAPDTEITSTGRRLSSSVEIIAANSVVTDEDGVPSISFSFLQQTEGKLSENCGSLRDESCSNLYDFPRGSHVELSLQLEKGSTDDVTGDRESPMMSCELQDPPRSSLLVEEKASSMVVQEEEREPLEAKMKINRMSGGSSDLPCRRSFGASERERRDPGIGSMSGSYSDGEYPVDAGSRLGGESLQRRKLGKAWGKMRSWLREEKWRIGEVVNRHARMQAVGALAKEQEERDKKRIGVLKSGSYDLTKARARIELGSITRVEEFGLASVTEELGAERESSRSPDSGLACSNARSQPSRSLRQLRTTSSDNILGRNAAKRSNRGRGPGSKMVTLSVDRLCSDSEAEMTEDAPEEAPKEATEGKGGLIKRRMLGSVRGLIATAHILHAQDLDEAGQGGFDDVRRYVKQGGDFCKELAAILHERAELEATYAKGLSKLSGKLTKAVAKDQGGNGGGGVNEAWRCVGEEMEAAAEAHRVWGIALGEQLAKPLRVGVAEAQGRSRKAIENSVDKASKSLQEWRGAAAKTKKQSFACARENERLQDLARLQSISQNQQNNNNSGGRSHQQHHMTEKEATKLESRRRKAEDSSRRADTEFYTVSVRAERARLEYESTVWRGAKQMELLEEERLSALKDLANVYLSHLQALAPKLQQSADRLSPPVRNCNVSQDVESLKNLIRRIENNESCNTEQLLPDFYAEHMTLAMNRERRKQALVRVLHLIRQDLDRERRGREGLETLHRAFIKTPAFAADESTQNVTDKLHHMRSMLMYFEAARYKVGGTLAEVEGSKRGKHPLAEHILVSRDKQGLQQSVLKIPSWAKNESFEIQDSQDELEVHLKEGENWTDRTAGDGNSENPPDEEDFSDFDGFSSQSEDNNNQDHLDVVDITNKPDGTERCRAIYQYIANLNDELSLNPGDLITVHQKQPDGWWIGECGGRTGIFPATYVQVIH
ncbi:uncharacterized protein Nost [Prorops nasuta]|uniref:uncharacterized protein Nost n=1 Tax=Prorops nasuta TaxID=863751 RepID=UPI0034CED52F